MKVTVDKDQATKGTPWLLIATFVLAILKLTGSITISWWWVFSPIWLPFAIILGLFALFFAGYGIYSLYQNYTLFRRKWEHETINTSEKSSYTSRANAFHLSYGNFPDTVSCFRIHSMCSSAVCIDLHDIRSRRKRKRKEKIMLIYSVFIITLVIYFSWWLVFNAIISLTFAIPLVFGLLLVGLWLNIKKGS